MAQLTLSDGETLYYEVLGNGPPLLLVPGIMGSATFWASLVPAFAERFTVVLHDHRGTGRSSHSRIGYSIDQMSADVLALMDGLKIERAHLVGHSAGGAIGQTLAIDRPECIDRLVLSGTWPGHDFYFRRFCEVRIQILEDSGPAAFARLSSLLLKPPRWFSEHEAEIEAQQAPGEQFAEQDLAILISRNRALMRFDRRDDLHRIKAPTLVIAARDDVPVPAYLSEELGRRVPGAEMVILSEGGHFFPQFLPSLYARIVIDFLTRDHKEGERAGNRAIGRRANP